LVTGGLIVEGSVIFSQGFPWSCGLLWTRREGFRPPGGATVSDGRMSTIHPALKIVLPFGKTMGIKSALCVRLKTAARLAARKQRQNHADSGSSPEFSFPLEIRSCKEMADFTVLLGTIRDNRFPQSLRIRKQKESLI
jgi:hypothetical protein